MREKDFDRLYAEHAGPLLAFLVYRTGDRVLAEDLVADTFERVLTSRRGFDRVRGSEKTWLYTIALNLVRDHARRNAVAGRAMEQVSAGQLRSAPPPQLAETISDHDALHRALEALSQEERDAISLRYGAELTVPEIARMTGEKLTTVEGRVYRALRKLKAELG